MRVGEERGGPFRGARSEDGAASFVRFATLPALPKNGRIVLAGSDCQRAVWVPQNAIPPSPVMAARPGSPAKVPPKRHHPTAGTTPIRRVRPHLPPCSICSFKVRFTSAAMADSISSRPPSFPRPLTPAADSPDPPSRPHRACADRSFVCLAENGLFLDPMTPDCRSTRSQASTTSLLRSVVPPRQQPVHPVCLRHHRRRPRHLPQ